MTNELIKLHLKEIMCKHIERPNAIKRPLILAQLNSAGITGRPQTLDRAVRKAKAELAKEGFPILSCTSDPGGYYLPGSKRELEQAIGAKPYLTGAASLLSNLDKNGRSWLEKEEARKRMEQAPVQGRLELG